MMAGFTAAPRCFTVPCTLDIEVTPESVHAHAVPEGVTLYPGDRVVVHGVPAHIDYGDKYTLDCTATVTRAGLLTRLWTRLTSVAEITELYEVSFAPVEPQHHDAKRVETKP
jgi:hypothetical protein